MTSSIPTEFLHPIPHPDGFTRTHNNSSVVFFNATPFVSLNVSTYYDAGYAYGKLLMPELLTQTRLIQFVLDSKISTLRPIVRPLARIILHRKLKAAFRLLPTQFQDEIRGCSDAGIPLIPLLFCSVGAEQLTPKNTHACSAFVCPSTEASNNDFPSVFHGHNLDYFPSSLGFNPCVIRYSFPDSFPYGLITFLGSFGALQGWNESSFPLSLSLNVLRDFVPYKRALPMAVTTRIALMNCSSISSICDYLSSQKAVFGWMVAVSSGKESKGFVMDFSHGEKSTVWTTPENTVNLACANRFLTKKGRILEKGLTNSKSGHLITGIGFSELINRMNEFRTLRIAQLLDKGSEITINHVISFLLDVGDCRSNSTAIGLGNLTIQKENTLQSIIFDLSGGQIRCHFGASYAGKSRQSIISIGNDYPNPRYESESNLTANQSLMSCTVGVVDSDRLNHFQSWHRVVTLLGVASRWSDALQYTWEHIRVENSINSDWIDVGLDCDYDILPVHLSLLHQAWSEERSNFPINYDLFCKLCRLCHLRFPSSPFLRYYLADVLFFLEKFDECLEILSYIFEILDLVENYESSKMDDFELLLLAKQGEMYNKLEKECFIGGISRGEVVEGLVLLVKVLEKKGQVKEMERVKIVGQNFIEKLIDQFGFGYSDVPRAEVFGFKYLGQNLPSN
ncbi:hypothetical protein RCL1_000438 [Eukaryota sp. TZLM3-RCL]